LSSLRVRSKKSRERQPFIRPDPETTRIAKNLRKGTERAQLWPTKLGGRTYYVIIYSRSWFPTRVRPTGYVLLDQKRRMIDNFETCGKLIATWRVWSVVYFYPPRKHSRLPRKWLSGRDRLMASIYEGCKQRLAENEYDKTEDPARLRLNRAIRELDQNVVDSYELVRRHQSLLEKAADEEKIIWEDPSFERIQAYVTGLLPRLKRSDDAMVVYLRNRISLTYESSKALREYESTATGTRRILVNIFAGLAAFVHPLYGVVIKFLDESAKKAWNDFTGYQGLIKQIEELQKNHPRIDRIIEAFQSPEDRDLVRKV